MMTPRLAVALLAGGLVAAPAVALEYPTFELLDVASAAAPECRTVALFNLPPAWRTGDGAAVLLTAAPLRDEMRDTLVAALLSEDAAVLELVPARCGGSGAGHDGVVASALGALDAVTVTAGAGLVVAIGYGPGGTAMLDAVREPAAGLLGVDGPRYAAAFAIGSEGLDIALGAPRPAQEQVPFRLAALCRLLATVAGGATAAETCRTAMAGETSLAATSTDD